MQFLDGIEAGLNLGQVEQRLLDPAPQQPRPHSRHRLVEHAIQASLCGFVAAAFTLAHTERRGQFQVAPRRSVEQHVVAKGECPQLINMRKRTALVARRLVEPEILQYHTGRRRRQWQLLAAKCVQRAHMKLCEQSAPRLLDARGLIRNRRDPCAVDRS